MEQQSRLSPLESGKLISEQAKDVTINPEKASALAKFLGDRFAAENYSWKSWKECHLHPQLQDRQSVDWIFFIDMMNFSFWSEDTSTDFTVAYNGENYIDYWALCSVVRRAIDEGIPLLSADYLAKVTDEEIRHIFRSASSVDLTQLETRRKILNAAGSVLQEKFNGSFSYCVEACNHSASQLLTLVLENFPAFRDEGVFNGTPISFYKRVQILIADLWACFENTGFGKFDDIDIITMFADYRVPQVLLHHGVLTYSEQLMTHLKEQRIVDVNHQWELEIRGATIWAVELVRRELVKSRNEKPVVVECKDGGTLSVPLNSIMIDFYLWSSSENLGLNDQSTDHPMHRTRTTFY